jgi:hypothetical protein
MLPKRAGTEIFWSVTFGLISDILDIKSSGPVVFGKNL